MYIKDLNVKFETIKILVYILGTILRQRMHFFDKIPKAQKIEAEIGKLYCISLQNFYVERKQ